MVKSEAQKAGIKISGFNGDADFSLIDASQREHYLRDLEASLQAAQKIGATSVTIHSNALGEGGKVINTYAHLSETEKLCAMQNTLLQAIKLAEHYHVRLHLEALNVKVDHVGNFLQTTQMAAEITKSIASPWLKVLYDAYHMQYNEGALIYHLEKYIDQIGHIHIADCPGRHEPGTGEICYANVYKALERLNYSGFVGYELFPKTDTQTAVKAIFQD